MRTDSPSHRTPRALCAAVLVAAWCLSPAALAGAQSHGSADAAHAPATPPKKPTSDAGHTTAPKPEPHQVAPPHHEVGPRNDAHAAPAAAKAPASGHGEATHAAGAKTPAARTATAAGAPVGGRAAADHGKAEARKPAASTLHADDDVEHAPLAPRAPATPPSGNKELDAVMQRINNRISATTGKSVGAPPRTSGATAAAHGAPAKTARGAASQGPGRVAPAPGPTPVDTPARVRLTWRPTVIWPPGVLDGGDRRVDVAWTPEVK